MTDQTNTPTTKQEEGGVVTVPREPTEVMRLAALNCSLPAIGEPPLYEKVWSAMIAATPANPPHNEEGLAEGLRDVAKFIQLHHPNATNWIYCTRAAEILNAGAGVGEAKRAVGRGAAWVDLSAIYGDRK